MHERPSPQKPVGLTVYCARAGDHDNLAMAGAQTMGAALSRRLGIPFTTIGTPEPALDADWKAELVMAMPALKAMADHLDSLFRQGIAPLCALSRCAVSLATFPVLMRHRPDACVVWFDAHGDLNTPQTTPSGYLGGMALSGPAGLWDSGLGDGLPLSSILLVGARDLDPAEHALIEAGMVSVVAPGEDCPARLRTALGGRPAYMHIDCDVLEPGLVPSDYQVPGGFALEELHAICQVLAGSEIVGLEIAEFENSWKDSGAPVPPDALLDALEPVIARLASPPATTP